jgi:hypothetical protein
LPISAFCFLISETLCVDTKAQELEDRLIDFAVRIIAVVEALPETRAGKHIASQLD